MEFFYKFYKLLMFNYMFLSNMFTFLFQQLPKANNISEPEG